MRPALRVSKLGAAFAALVFTLVPLVVWAIADPDSIDILSVRCYQGVIDRESTEPDMLCLLHYNISYATLPAENVNEAFIARFITSTVEVNSVNPFVFPGTLTSTTTPPGRGYGEGVASFYWSSAAVADLGVPFGGTGYQVILQGDPLTFDAIGTGSKIIFTAVDFRTPTGSSPELIRQDLLEIIKSLEEDWSDNAISLTSFQSGVEVLTTDGANYFLQAVPNLDIMSPRLFNSQLLIPDTTRRDISTSTSGRLEAYWDDTPFAIDGFGAIADLFQIPDMLARTMMLTVLMAIVFILVVRMSNNPTWATVCAFGIIWPAGALLGFTYVALVMATGFVAFMIVGFKWIL